MKDSNGVELNDGVHTVYLNTSVEYDGTELSALAHDFKCSDYSNMLTEPMRESVYSIKDGERTDFMCELMEKLIAEEKAEAEERAKEAEERAKEAEERAKEAEERVREIEEMLGKLRVELDKLKGNA